MSCHEFEGLIALHIEGDLDGTERQRVESHLRGCLDCQSLAEELRESQAAFKSMRQDVADRSALSSVRARVLESVADMESGSLFERWFWGGFRQRATLAGIALVLIGAAALWFLPEREIARRSPADTVAVAQSPILEPEPAVDVVEVVEVAEAAPTPVPKPAVRPPRRDRQQPAVVPSEPQPQVTIKLLTDDPNVIIYWLGDEKGD